MATHPAGRRTYGSLSMAGTKRRRTVGMMRAQAMSTAPEFHGIVPEEAMVEVLDRATSWLRFWAKKADALKHEELYEVTAFGTHVHPALKLEAEARGEVTYISSKMLGLEIDNRRALAAERMAEALAPVFKEVFEQIKLTPAQKRKVPSAIRGGLQLLEGGAANKAA